MIDDLKPFLVEDPETKQKYVGVSDDTFSDTRWALLLEHDEQAIVKPAEKRRFKEKICQFLRKKLVGKYMKLPTNKKRLGLIININAFDQKQRRRSPFYSFIVDILVGEEIYKICWHRSSMELIAEIEKTKKELGIK